MTAPHGRSYPSDAIIFVDPDRAGSARNGDLVIATVAGTDEVTFKMLVKDAGVSYLRPLNPAYLPITQEFRVIGKVIGMWIAT